MEAARLADPVEQRRLGRGHPHLAAAFEAREQRRSANRVEMGGNFVQQNDRRCSALPLNEFGVRQYDPDQQGLLLAR
jgi:hypothetical protein